MEPWRPGRDEGGTAEEREGREQQELRGRDVKRPHIKEVSVQALSLNPPVCHEGERGRVGGVKCVCGMVRAGKGLQPIAAVANTLSRRL